MGSLEKKNPEVQTVGQDCEELGIGDGVGALPKRLARYEEAHRRALLMSDYAASQGERVLANRLSNCGHWLVFRHYFTVDKLRLNKADFCRKHLLCPLCAIRRATKYMQAYMQRLDAVLLQHPGLQAFLVTVTVKDGPDLYERFQHLRSAMRRMTQARRDHLSNPIKNRHVEAAKALGGVHSIEFKRGKGSGLWHPHAHAIWLCNDRPNAAKLSQEWLGFTGDSFIVDVRPFHNQADLVGGFAEVFKYALKFSDLELSDTWEAFEILTARRLVDSFGLLRGVDVPDELTDEPLDGLPYVELFFNYLHGNYSLHSFTRSDLELAHEIRPCP